MGCPNEVVREMIHKDDPSIGFGLCAFHVRTGLKYMTDEQVRRMVLPPLSFDATGSSRGAETETP